MTSPVGRGLRRLAGEVANLCGLLIAAVVMLAAAVLVVATAAPGGFLRGAVVVLCALYLSVVVHEFGHFLAARLAGVPVVAIDIGGPPFLASSRLGRIQLGVGVRPRGQVRLRRLPSAGRSAVIVAAGPLASLLVAAIALAVPGHPWLAESVAVIFGGFGLLNLIPFSRRGLISDGSRLLALPARHAAEKDVRRLTSEPGWPERPDAADRLLAGHRRGVSDARERLHTLAVLLRKHGRTEELLALHKQRFRTSDTPDQATVNAVLLVEWAVVTVPGLPRPAADLAAHRIQWAISHLRAGLGDALTPLLAAQHSLAVARLRQRRFAEVEALCVDALAATSLTAAERATVLATVAMARHALGQDFRTPLDQAAALDPGADLVGEARALVQDRVPPRAAPGFPVG